MRELNSKEFMGLKFEDLEWESEIDPVTGTEFNMKFLLADDDTGMDFVYSRYPKGYCKPAHHHDFAQGLYILEGTMQANGKLYHEGDFVWFPEGSVGTHGATDDGDVVFLALGNGAGKGHVFYD